jgi:hypothetical protein
LNRDEKTKTNKPGCPFLDKRTLVTSAAKQQRQESTRRPLSSPLLF